MALRSAVNTVALSLAIVSVLIVLLNYDGHLSWVTNQTVVVLLLVFFYNTYIYGKSKTNPELYISNNILRRSLPISSGFYYSVILIILFKKMQHEFDDLENSLESVSTMAIAILIFVPVCTILFYIFSTIIRIVINNLR